MLSLAETTDLLEQTTSELTTSPDQLTAQTGVARIDQWLPALSSAENTQPLAQALTSLKAQLTAQPLDPLALQDQLETLAQTLTTLSADMGSEGDMPGLFTGLAAALRQLANGAQPQP